jgi:hypothetical protein
VLCVCVCVCMHVLQLSIAKVIKHLELRPGGRKFTRKEIYVWLDHTWKYPIAGYSGLFSRGVYFVDCYKIDFHGN